MRDSIKWHSPPAQVRCPNLDSQSLKESGEAKASQRVGCAVTETARCANALAKLSKGRDTTVSTLWQAARRLRVIGSRVSPRIRRAALGAAKVAWWSVTFKLPRKLRERRLLTKTFDAEWYLRTYADVAAAGLDPLSHYLSSGAAEGRDPAPGFSTVGYLNRNADVAAVGANPLLHYVQIGRAEGRKITPIGSPENNYKDWICRHDTLTEADLTDMRRRGAELPHRPKISILMPTYNTPEVLLREAIDSVIAQTYENWELCVADDASTAPGVAELIRSYERADPRIKATYRQTNGQSTLATNSALELATGEWVTTLDHDDLLSPHALFHVIAALNSHPATQLIYSDDDKIDASGDRYDAHFKPDFSLELFRSQNYLNHLTVHRMANVRALGGWRTGFDGSHDYDLNLRLIERIDPSTICHVPQVLYHQRAPSSPSAFSRNAAFRALQDHVKRLRLPAVVEEIAGLPIHRLRFNLPDPAPLVSIIIPTRDRVDLLRMSVGSILEKTTYEPFEILIVDNGSLEKTTKNFLVELEREPRIRVLHYPYPFNYSAINNFAARTAVGEILALVNNDVEVISRDWLTEMVTWAAQDDVGCVGAKLYYSNNTIQHAGVILGLGELAGHSHKHYPRDHPGYFYRLKSPQTLSAVTGACLVVRKELYLNVGGMDEDSLRIALNDVDFCLKVREAGYRNVWTPFAELYHHESVSRGRENTLEKRERAFKEVQFMRQKWGTLLDRDPFYSPHLTTARQDFSIRECEPE